MNNEWKWISNEWIINDEWLMNDNEWQWSNNDWMIK